MTASVEYATQRQAKTELDKLTHEEHALLRQKAKNYLSGTIYTEPADLLHEAFYRCLAARRQWPLHIDFISFIVNSMKSIASADRGSFPAKSIKSANTFEGSLGSDAISMLGPKHPSPEDLIIQQENLDAVIAMQDKLKIYFIGDPTARMIIDGWIVGYTSEELKKHHGMSDKKYNAARQRVYRKLEEDKTRRANRPRKMM
jgi:hypothetical protein